MNASVTELHTKFSYNPETGCLIRISGRHKGSLGTVGNHGYIQMHLKGEIKLAHRIIWAMQTGEWPAVGLYLDHINGDRLDNRWCNLRMVTPSQSQMNTRSITSNGSKGIHYNKATGKWRAYINVNYKRHYVGNNFSTAKEAQAARNRAAKELHGAYSKPGALQ